MFKSTLFRKIFFSVILTEVIVFGAVSFYSMVQTSESAKKAELRRESTLIGEMKNIIQLEGQAIDLLERLMDIRHRQICNMIDGYLVDKSMVDINLFDLREKLEMNPEFEDLYLINPDNIIVNATFTKDVGLDLDIFGDVVSKMLSDTRTQNTFLAEGIALDFAKNKFKKYGYYPIANNYIVEVGTYALETDSIHNELGRRLTQIVNDDPNLESFNVFFSSDNNTPVSLYLEQELDSSNFNILKRALANSRDTTYFVGKGKTSTYHRVYHFDDLNSSVFKSAVLYTVEKKDPLLVAFNEEKSRAITTFFIIMITLFVVMNINVRRALKPLSILVKQLKSLESGNLSERTSIKKGVEEFKNLSSGINSMADSIETSYRNLENGKKQIEEAHKEISDSINYAKRIQTAILPPPKVIKKNLSNSFVLYIPKDVVAGDFYWMEKVGDSVVLAAADCTGHGVPGAMVSVVCNNALNRSVREFGLTEPAAILNQTRDIVIEEFDQGEEEVKDGMDISLCALNTKTNILNWAGANNPIWVVRKGSTEIEEIKADKQPIGKFELAKPFTNHEIQLNQGDRFFVFSDGFPDQFGGKLGKKYKSGKFKKLLLSHLDKDIAQYETILKNEFEDWRKLVEQIDDVCVIGVEV